MFNQHLYPSFHSLKDFFEEAQKNELFPSDDDRMTRLSLWRDSLDQEVAKKLLKTEPSKAKLLEKKLEKTPKPKKLNYLPKRLSKLAGIEKFFPFTNVQVITPTAFKNDKYKKFQNKFFYLIPRNVTVSYGPYFYLGILDYRTERLHGLLAALKFAGANTFLRPSNHINHVSVWYLEKEIFSCKITNLQHGGDGELDPLAYDAAMAFKGFSKKVLLNVRHKYRFDKQKGNLFRKCPCHEDYPGSPFLDDDDYEEEFLGEDEYINPYTSEQQGEDESDEMYRGGKILRRISLPSHLRIKFHPRELSVDRGQQPDVDEEEQEFLGEDEPVYERQNSLERKSILKRVP